MTIYRKLHGEPTIVTSIQDSMLFAGGYGNTNSINITAQNLSVEFARISGVTGRLKNLEENQITGVVVVTNYVDRGDGRSFLPPVGVELVSYKVADDSYDPRLNGFYRWENGEYEPDAITEQQNTTDQGFYILNAEKEVSNLLANSGESEFSTQRIFEPIGNVKTVVDAPEDLPISNYLIDKIYEFEGVTSSDFKFSIGAHVVPTGGKVSFSFFARKSQWDVVNNNVIGVRQDGAFISLPTPQLIGDPSVSTEMGGIVVSRIYDKGDWVAFSVDITNYESTSTYFEVRIGSQVRSVLQVANVNITNSVLVSADNISVRYKNKASSVRGVLTDHEERIGTNESNITTLQAGVINAQSSADNAQSSADNAQSSADNAQETASIAENAIPDQAFYLLNSEKEASNIISNSGEEGFDTQQIMDPVGNTVSVVPSPADLPISDTLISEIYELTSGSAYDFKFSIGSHIVPTGGRVSFSFFARKSQWNAVNNNVIGVRQDGAFISLPTPQLIGDPSVSTEMGGIVVSRIYDKGDWVAFSVDITNYESTYPYLEIRIGVGNTLTLQVANINIISSELVSGDNLSVRYKNKPSSVRGILSDHEERIEELESSGSDITKKIVCFGDSLTAAADGYVTVLQNILGNEWDCVNRGVGGENTRTIVARHGGSPMYISNISIPADTTPVSLGGGGAGDVQLRWLYNDSACHPLLQKPENAGINPLYVEGIACNLTWTGGTSINDPNGEYLLTRIEEGRAITTRYKSIITPYNLIEYKDAHLQIIFMGTNGGYVGETDYMNQLAKVTDTVPYRRSLVISSHSPNVSDLLRERLNQRYGIFYIDLRTYMGAYGIYDAIDRGYLPDDGTYPTQEDLDAMALGNCPPSLLKDTIHFNTVGNQIFGELVHAKLVEAGLI